MPFFENTEILRRDVQVLDHILTMEIQHTFCIELDQTENYYRERLGNQAS
jgi:hypothetical protein